MSSQDPRSCARRTSARAAALASTWVGTSCALVARTSAHTASTTSIASWSLITPHRPSEPYTTQLSTPGCSAVAVTSGCGEMRGAGSLKSRSPRPRLTAHTLAPRPGPSGRTMRHTPRTWCTMPPTASMRARSMARLGLWSLDSDMAAPPRPSTARQSPALATYSLRPTCSPASAVEPSMSSGPPTRAVSRHSASSCSKAAPNAARTASSSARFTAVDSAAGAMVAHRSRLAATSSCSRAAARVEVREPEWPSNTPAKDDGSAATSPCSCGDSLSMMLRLAGPSEPEPYPSYELAPEGEEVLPAGR
mmetsp:Transcript_28731/g.73081  ORF Transcript_28731/g.73081 Transcript_28731/m.73081 type:complete len:306 (-) Transcript_28731:808-1725(-)